MKILFTALFIIALGISNNATPCSCTNEKYGSFYNKSDSVKSPGNTVLDFLRWYKVSFDKNPEDEMVNNSPGHKDYDPAKNYSVNFEGTERYLKYMKSSGYVSDKYLDHWRKYFKKCDANFRKNPKIDDMPPDGFDYDFVYLSHEIGDYNVDNMEINKEIIKNNKAEVIITIDNAFIYKYKLTYDGKKWLIDSLDYNDSK
jgi:hypothetical protein